MPLVGIGELILVLLIALLVFGPGRIASLGGELGKSIRAFQDGIRGAGAPAEKESEAGDTN